MTAASPALHTASVVIPAHDEAAVIDRCLDALLVDARPGEFEVVVVCNACTDDTATRAALHPGVSVRELAAPGKVGALNLGDTVVSTMPRIYLDADVVLDTASARALVTAARSGAAVSAPQPILDLRRASRTVRLYFEVWSRLGHVVEAGLGSGVYVLSAEARSRFGHFPDVVADDAFVQRTFGRDERVSPAGAHSVVTPPSTLRALVRRRVRLVRGNRTIAASLGTATAIAPSWRQVARADPRLVPATVVYLLVNVSGYAVASLPSRRAGATTWSADHTSRQAR